MAAELDRRSVIGLSVTGALTAVLAACGTTEMDDKPATSMPAAPPSGRPPDMLMFIRHAEEPGKSGKPPYGVTEAGERDDRSLSAHGWTRAGALVELFAPREADASQLPARRGISRPAAIFASDPGSKDTRRPQETITPLAAALDVQADSRFALTQHAELAAALRDYRGSVLVCWRHYDIAPIIAGIGAVHPAPPAIWPEDRFDVVYVLTRDGSRWNFTQVPQMLLAGDSPTPIT